MQTICSKGFKISSIDKKALEHYLLITPKDWSVSALDGMINKAIKTILKDWFSVYKSKQQDSVSVNLPVVIPAIIAMEEFETYKVQTPRNTIIDRKEEPSEEIWTGGFNVEDYEKQALDAYYLDPEEMLYYFMENKIYQRRKAFLKEFEESMFKNPEIQEIPAKEDDFINLICNQPGYKNRAQRELL